MRISGCHTTPLYRTAGWTPLMREMLIEYLAWNKLNGMGKQRMYLLKEEEPVATWLAPLFDYFGGDGFLEVLEWRYPQVPASFFGQLLLQYDCLYR